MNSNCALITGSAGFIGFHLADYLLKDGWQVVGVDGMTDYYDTTLKKNRQNILKQHKAYFSREFLIEEEKKLEMLCKEFNPKIIIHLAAQAGVRYSYENPRAYVDSNIIGSFNVLEAAKNCGVKHLLIASTSSVYGSNEIMPFTEKQKCDTQMSFYASTKKAMEVMSHSHSHTFDMPVTVFRFFTVYGPWGRPDMALFKFANAILENRPIEIFNYGNMSRDFTYIDDLITAIAHLINAIPSKSKEINDYENDSISNVAPWRVVNIGNSKPVALKDYISALEAELGIRARKNFVDIQMGEVPQTWADNTLLKELTGFKPNTNIKKGVKNFVKWYKQYKGISR